MPRVAGVDPGSVSFDLVVLEDDLGYFPNYHGAPLAREASAGPVVAGCGCSLHRLIARAFDCKSAGAEARPTDRRSSPLTLR